MTDLKIYAPLSDFVWRGSRFTVAPGVELVPRPSHPYPLRGRDELLSGFDRYELFWANHWLVIDGSEEDEDPSELLNCSCSRCGWRSLPGLMRSSAFMSRRIGTQLPARRIACWIAPSGSREP